MNSILVPLLRGIDRATSAGAYLQAQDEALVMAAAQHEQLQIDAREQEHPGLRMEALGLIALLSRDDAANLLLVSAQDDPDLAVAEHARALLYHLDIARNVRESGRMSAEQIAAYQGKLRRQRADARFAQRTK
ncbi:hypothetical protein [Solimonas sp. SE-A11]|uniref:hypothetical protein n=1 Tax=Solimonas sp. SE-A11 TaxID=3054954 RepID=UPI00259CEEB5|nr:hypothetical protein [Solimonas sp. SE-A11]MDM4772655.1 hypothetical protein [Solimonas sp. SE-A11]